MFRQICRTLTEDNKVSSLSVRTSNDDYLIFKSGVKSAAWNLGYDLSLYEPTNENYALGKIIPLSGMAYDNNMITGGKYDEILLNIFRGDMVYNTLKGDDDIV